MKYTVDCPSCAHEFEILSMLAAHSGLRCPQCDTGFVPEKVDKRHTPQEIEQMEAEDRREERRLKWQHYQSLKDKAGALSIFGIVFLAVAVIAACIDSYVVAGSSFSLCITLFILAQLVHIRAGLEKLSIKE